MNTPELSREQARAMDRCDRVPHTLDIERAWGIVKIHSERGTCTPEDCLRLAAAVGFIEDADTDRPRGIMQSKDGGLATVDNEGWTEEINAAANSGGDVLSVELPAAAINIEATSVIDTEQP
ncbi:hypothetical protein [Nocardia sp. NBC_00403]|uniref:hypothetical protein n=1 Tax=Nocardia sp. NBC_00403 TaxID=2975990 RepID=UPI002E20223D